MRNIPEFLSEKQDSIGTYGLGTVFFLAGASKFVSPGVWAAYEPVFLTDFSPISTDVHMYMSGVFEVSLAIMLFLNRRVFQVSVVLALWTLGITASILYMGFWSIALRDFGILVLAVYVAASAYSTS